MKQVIYSVSLTILSIILFVIAGEVGLRLAGYPFDTSVIPQETSVGQYDKETGWSYKPEFSASVKSGSPQRDVSYHFDELGLRVAAPGLSHDPEKPTILFVGGSITMGHGLDHAETYPALIEAGIDGSCQVVNAGVQGFGTDQALIMLKRRLEQFNVIAVVYTFINNHILRNNVDDRRLLYRRARFIGTKPLFALDENGQPYLKRVPRQISWSSDLSLWSLIRYARFVRTSNDVKYDPALTYALISEMRSLTESKDADFHVFYWRYRRGKQDYGDAIRQLGVNFVDVEPGAPPEWNEWRLPDKHPDIRGAAYGAEVLLQGIDATIQSKCLSTS